MKYKQKKIQVQINKLIKEWATKEFISAYVHEIVKKEQLQREIL